MSSGLLAGIGAAAGVLTGAWKARAISKATAGDPASEEDDEGGAGGFRDRADPAGQGWGGRSVTRPAPGGLPQSDQVFVSGVAPPGMYSSAGETNTTTGYDERYLNESDGAPSHSGASSNAF